jgi:hypothetical protein
VKKRASSVVHLTGCDSIALNGITYYSGGSYDQNLKTVHGCDSNLTAVLTIHNASSAAISLSSCDSIIVNSIEYDSSGTYTQSLHTVTGCDSILTINHSRLASGSTVFVDGCDSIVVNGEVFRLSGNYRQTMPNQAGCDSVLLLNVTVTSIDTGVVATGSTFTSNTPNAAYQWINCLTGVPVANATARSFTPVSGGSYQVAVEVNSCYDTSACYVYIRTGIDSESADSKFTIRPNPTTGLVSFTIDPGLNAHTLIVADVLGRITGTVGLPAQGDQILMEGNEGMYFISLIDGNGRLISVRKVLLQNGR